MMNLTVFVTFWLIVLARITDVSLDTIRMISVIQGRRAFAALLGFFEAVVYICAVAKVLLNMNQPVYAVAYGLGFAAGTYLGMVIEQRLAFGKQLVFLLTPKDRSWPKSCVRRTIAWLKLRDVSERAT
jgi:uncharacterized protein YebE (UPF0316 family)